MRFLPAPMLIVQGNRRARPDAKRNALPATQKDREVSEKAERDDWYSV